jgi:predicted dehydrogenase
MRKRTQEEKYMRIGILGTGFGAYHAKLYKDKKGVDDITVFGRKENRLMELEKELNVKTARNIQDIITNDQIDLIDVCLPSSLHKEYAIEAMKNGKNVYIETPVAFNLDDAYCIKEAAEKYKKKVFVDLFIKFDYAYQYLHEVCKNNTYGKLKTLNIKRATPHIWGDLGLDKIAINFMIHELDFVTWLSGSPKEIIAAGISGNSGEAQVQALLNYDDTIIHIEASSMMKKSSPFTVSYEAVFENAVISYINNGYPNYEEKSLTLFTDDEKQNLIIEDRNCHEESIKHVLQCIENNASTIIGIDAAITSLEALLKIQDMILRQNR